MEHLIYISSAAEARTVPQGFLSHGDVSAMVAALGFGVGPEYVASLIELVDLNKDGRVRLGLGHIAALYDCASASYQVHEHVQRTLCI